MNYDTHDGLNSENRLKATEVIIMTALRQALLVLIDRDELTGTIRCVSKKSFAFKEGTHDVLVPCPAEPTGPSLAFCPIVHQEATSRPGERALGASCQQSDSYIICSLTVRMIVVNNER